MEPRYLKVVRGVGEGKVVPLLAGKSAVIGRNQECDLTIVDPAVSRRHCAILLRDDGSTLVTDLNSRNGTRVNGELVNRPTEMSKGDTINFGCAIVELREGLEDQPINSENATKEVEKFYAETLDLGRLVSFCERCDTPINQAELDSGKARTVAGIFVCAACQAAAPPVRPQLGGYLLLYRLKNGTIGDIYRAVHKESESDAAVKVVSKGMCENPESVKVMFEQLAAASRLDHANICKVYEIDQDDGHSYIASELVIGKDLAEVIQVKEKLSLRAALRIGLEVAAALDHAHRREIHHFNLKPTNVLLSQDNLVKISDFGVFGAIKKSGLGKSTGSLYVINTAAYMAPEQLKGEPPDPRSDLYSLGGILYFAATGRAPFDGRKFSVLLEQILKQEPPPLAGACPQAPPSFTRAIERCLAKDPGQRFQSAAEVLEALKNV